MTPRAIHYLARLAALECDTANRALRDEVIGLYDALTLDERATVPQDGRSRWACRADYFASLQPLSGPRAART